MLSAYICIIMTYTEWLPCYLKSSQISIAMHALSSHAFGFEALRSRDDGGTVLIKSGNTRCEQQIVMPV